MDSKEKQHNSRQKNYTLMRSLSDYGRGFFILGIGTVILFAEKFGLQLAVDGLLRYMLAGIAVLYGGFRIYRGYAKQYFRKDD